MKLPMFKVMLFLQRVRLLDLRPRVNFRCSDGQVSFPGGGGLVVQGDVPLQNVAKP